MKHIKSIFLTIAILFTTNLNMLGSDVITGGKFVGVINLSYSSVSVADIIDSKGNSLLSEGQMVPIKQGENDDRYGWGYVVLDKNFGGIGLGHRIVLWSYDWFGPCENPDNLDEACKLSVGLNGKEEYKFHRAWVDSVQGQVGWGSSNRRLLWGDTTVGLLISIKWKPKIVSTNPDLNGESGWIIIIEDKKAPEGQQPDSNP